MDELVDKNLPYFVGRNLATLRTSHSYSNDTHHAVTQLQLPIRLLWNDSSKNKPTVEIHPACRPTVVSTTQKTPWKIQEIRDRSKYLMKT